MALVAVARTDQQRQVGLSECFGWGASSANGPQGLLAERQGAMMAEVGVSGAVTRARR
jgi:hypothetical protein